jgi:hypothetical protein
MKTQFMTASAVTIAVLVSMQRPEAVTGWRQPTFFQSVGNSLGIGDPAPGPELYSSTGLLAGQTPPKWVTADWNERGLTTTSSVNATFKPNNAQIRTGG